MKARLFESTWHTPYKMFTDHRGALIPTTFLGGMLVTVSGAFAQFWQPTGASSDRWSSLACSADGTRLVAVAGPFIYASSNSGATWFQTGAPSNSWTSVASSADGVKLVAASAVLATAQGGDGHGGPVFTSTNAGATWQPTASPNYQWSSVASSGDGASLVAAAAFNNSNTAYGLVFISTNSGMSWYQSGAPTNYWYSVAVTADGTKLIAGGYTDLFISTDGGATWVADNIPWDPQYQPPVWVAVALSADGATLLGIRHAWASSPRSYVSTNSGATWTSHDLSGYPGGYWGGVVASSADGSRLLALTTYLYESMNSGGTWTRQGVPGVDYECMSGCVTLSADGGRTFLAVGADDWGRPGSIYTRYLPRNPRLNIAALSSNVILSWIVPSTNFIVQGNSDLTMTNWLNITNTPTLNSVSLQNEVILPASVGSGLYRLATP